MSLSKLCDYLFPMLERYLHRAGIAVCLLVGLCPFSVSLSGFMSLVLKHFSYSSSISWLGFFLLEAMEFHLEGAIDLTMCLES